MTIKVKKVTKYSRYFLLLAVASLASLVLAERSGGSLSDTSQGGVIPIVHADAPGGDSGDSGDGDAGSGGGSDCGSAGDCL